MLDVGLVSVNVLVSLCFTAQYSKSIPSAGMHSAIFAKSYEVILFWTLMIIIELNMNSKFTTNLFIRHIQKQFTKLNTKLKFKF